MEKQIQQNNHEFYKQIVKFIKLKFTENFSTRMSDFISSNFLFERFIFRIQRKYDCEHILFKEFSTKMHL